MSGLLIGIKRTSSNGNLGNVIPSVDNGPFAVETLLGWVINGPIIHRQVVKQMASRDLVIVFKRLLPYHWMNNLEIILITISTKEL